MKNIPATYLLLLCTQFASIINQYLQTFVDNTNNQIIYFPWSHTYMHTIGNVNLVDNTGTTIMVPYRWTKISAICLKIDYP